MEEARIRKSFEFWQVQLHLDPQSKATKPAIKDRRSQLQLFMDRKEDGRRIQSTTKWMKSQDKMNRVFFFLSQGASSGRSHNGAI